MLRAPAPPDTAENFPEFSRAAPASVAGVAVVVIGAHGALGRLCVDALRESGLEIVRAGRRREEAADFRFIDLDEPDSIAEACADTDLVVNTVRHPAHPAERVILKKGGTLINVASLTASDRAELKATTDDGRGLVVLHAGLAPGVYSLVFKDMLAAHPEADCLELAGAWSAFQTSGPGGATDGLYSGVQGGGHRATRLVEFPEPIGRRRSFHLGGAELGFFGEVATGREARVYLCIHERPIQAALLALNSLRLLTRLPRATFTSTRRWTKGRTTREPKRDILAVTRNGQRLAAQYVEGEGDYLMTASATAAFVEALRARRASGWARNGVLGADEIFDIGELRPSLEERGMRILPLPS
jgi:hypothetical protein